MSINKLKSILIVDDEDIACFTSTMIIQRMEFTGNIQSAYNGMEALEILKITRSLTNVQDPEPQLILLDINMPGMDGFDFLEALDKTNKLNLKNLYIAMLTSSTNRDDKMKALKFNVSGFLIKPLTAEKLDLLINSMKLS